MAGINVLSDILKGGNKVENIAATKGKEASDGYKNAATVFAAMLNGRLSQSTNSKGQSSLADQDSEGKQSDANLVQSDQSSKGLENVLGYGNFVLPFLNQMLQSDLPAGKEANSGDTMSQGIEDSLLANLGLNKVPDGASMDLEEAMKNLVSLASDEGLGSTGMIALSTQGDNLEITELDKYRQLITNLLVELSGVITESTPKQADNMGLKSFSQEMAQIIQGWGIMTEDNGEGKGASFNVAGATSDSLENEKLRQELAKIVQDWLKVTDDGIESSGQNRLQKLIEGFTGSSNGGNPELNAKLANLLAVLYPSVKEGTEGVIRPQGESELIQRQLKDIEIDLEAVLNPKKEVASQDIVQQRLQGTDLRESKLINNFKDMLNEEINNPKHLKSVDSLGSKDNQAQPAGVGVGTTGAANLVHLASVDGKINTVPLWEQITTVLREQVMSKQQALKELDIQLHPAELGNIRIFLRWESGQVHLQVQASEAATGQLLQNQLSDLRQNLIDQGVNCGSLQMGQGGDGQQRSQGDEDRRTLQQSNLTIEDDDQIAINNPHSLGLDGTNRINVTA